MRLAILLSLCAGCHAVFLDEQIQSSICGPYEDPEPVPFAAGLPALTHFSAVGNVGFAREKDSFRQFALAFDGAVWAPDPTRQANLDMLRTQENLHFVHVAGPTTMFGGQLVNGFYRVFEYSLANNEWSRPNPMPVASGTLDNVIPGGSIAVGTSPNDYRYHASAHEAQGDGKFVVVDVSPQAKAWRPEESAGSVSTAAINNEHATSQATLAIGRNERPTLIYAATSKNKPASSDLFVSERVSGRFRLGVELLLGGEDGDEVEPSTNFDCTLLYFRRGDQILQARAQ